MPDLEDEQIVQAIASAPSGTVRSVLRALCADEETKLCIGRFLSQLPLTYEEWDQSRQASSSSASRKRKTAPQIEICVQCESPFEKGDESLTCRHHPCEFHVFPTYDMEVDFDSDFWADWDVEIDDTPCCRETNPDGFTFPRCGETGSSVDEGCTMGKHRAADGKRGK
ncbi:hypothetical protein B0H65DRAFT_81852 [Neurospora tetraspora]|uniref:C2H2-type domain-containing protein n=1 Tax=Neurospora tetraspora TaxID=94610 RepID=A0AAE0MJ00_9PEZI|nr:hypothetical protein B0H65DRAFT_81852 [Neurospora tetraspora]